MRNASRIPPPNRLELCCPAARADFCPFSRTFAGEAPCLFARQPGQHQRVVGRTPPPLLPHQ